MLFKKIKDQFIKLVLGKNSVPFGLFELEEYFRFYGTIDFKIKKEARGWVAISKNFRHGSIVTSGKSKKELDRNVEDAILTAFEVPSSYKKEANLRKRAKDKNSYAFA